MAILDLMFMLKMGKLQVGRIKIKFAELLTLYDMRGYINQYYKI